ncbi:restriction endonuclease subunit S [Halomonas litopenaei]|uniref:Restriction endonuclease subunit S n=1 Tax=Halomonas litopenaei TaxID=2109328 RepID=A0ABX5ITU7_9GAMM|nr:MULTISPECIES: restriction endonuclease subunit S [Halomonas]PTL89167.1 restriction endonuclease subunit S [Halomonas litopenaei]PTL89433.1 restriction endonuclease subunit S [Halomonas sp. SYSU XM8]
MTFPKYPEYKVSRVEWLGEVPAHWGVVPLRGAAKQEAYSFTDGDWVETPFITDEGVRLIQTGNIGVGKYREQGFRYISEETFSKLNCTEFFPGDVLICRLADPVGRACLAPDLGARMITSVDVCILKTKSEISSNFLVYFLSSDPYLSFMASVSRGGTRERVSRSFLGSVRILMPSVEEQSSIVAFLDHETARIDALVEEQQRLIELLKEKRQAVISHAVTKGLDPDVPMKDSGVEWLGEVPAHWEVGGLTKFIGPVVDYRGRTPKKVDDGIFLVTAKNIRDGRIDYEVSKEYADPESAKSLLERGKPEIGDLLFTMEAPLGQVALIDRTDIALAQRIVKFKGGEGVMMNSYLMYWLMSTSCQARMETLATGSTALGIKASKLGMIECPAPPVAEQEEIVSHIKRESAKHDVLLVEAQANIDLLQERRSALISAAVTGKIDVRGWQPPAGSSATSVTKQTEAV